jgi:hypothetical protein
MMRVLDWPAWQAGGYQLLKGGRCASSSHAFTADFSNTTFRPGEVKDIVLTHVPVPQTAGWWQVSALPDLNCELPATPMVRSYPAFTIFKVIA